MQPQSSSETSGGGMLDGLKNLFGSESNGSAADPNPISQKPPKAGLSGSSTSEPLSAETEKQLRAVPDVIGAEEEDELSAPSAAAARANAAAEAGADPVTALMAAVAFEEQDVQDTLAELFSWVGERFDSDHWKLTDRQQRMLGKPATQMLNALWVKLTAIMPDILTRWCESTPGATAFLMAAGIVVVPKVTQQIQLNRQRKRTQQQQPMHVPPQPVAAWAPKGAANA